MHPREVLSPQATVLDIGVSDAAVARDLADLGVSRYLGLAHPDDVVGLRSDHPDLAHRFHPLESPRSAVHASADLLILRSGHERILWATRELREVRHVAVEQTSGRSRLTPTAATLLARRTGRLAPSGTIELGATTFDLIRISNAPRRPAPRRYFSPVWGPEGLAARLGAAGLDYAVLRWFEDLPHMDPGEDLDVLVADHDLDAFQALLREEPGTIPLDLYSVRGLPSSDYQKAAYYPPTLAEEILRGAHVHTSGFRVPSPREHLLSLAYHAVYHKGPSSGIPSDRVSVQTDPEHDYQQILAGLASAQGVASVPTTLEEWDDYLASEGWRPAPDALRKLAPSNPWIVTPTVARHTAATDAGELAVFLIREETLKVIPVEEVLEVLHHFGFDDLATIELSGEARRRCESDVRGGNWGRGPYPRSGGPPVILIVALHYSPPVMHEFTRARYPHLTNADVLRVKLHLRALVADRVPPDQTFNPMHSADNETEAYEYLAAGAPDVVPELRAVIDERVSHLSIDVPVRQSLSRGRRSRVDVVDGSDGPVVRKTYAPPFTRHLEREIAFMEEMHGVVEAVPEVLDRGPNWFTMPHFANTIGSLSQGRLLPLPLVHDMLGVLQALLDHGFDLVDAKPGNFLNDPEAGLKVVDFEFVHRYEGTPPPLEQSMAFSGAAPGFAGDVPVADLSYVRQWLPHTGVPLAVLLHGSRAEQQAHRARFRVTQATTAPGSPLRRPLGRARRSAGRLRGVAVARYGRWARRRAGL